MSEPRPAGLFDLDAPTYGNAVMRREAPMAESRSAQERGIDEDLLRHFPTRDEKVFQVLEVARTVAPTKVPLLISGESGTGKEMLAKAIHICGGRERGRFVVGSCSNLPPNFFEMEIFMVQSGDFKRPIENCTLLLDEICDLDATMQLRLLRLLKEQEATRNMVRRGTAVDSRIICCTTRNLEDEVNAGRFRQDLFYKLHVIHLDLPTLRDRPIDIDFYSEIFMREFNIQFSKSVHLSPTAKQALRTYPWPGNVRELRNVIQRAVLLATREFIGVDELHLVKANSRTEHALQETLPQITLRELEQRLILQTLRRMNGNRTHTAKALGISLRALRYKLNELVAAGYEVEGKNA